jgi:hypothetical protein
MKVSMLTGALLAQNALAQEIALEQNLNAFLPSNAEKDQFLH